MMEISISLPGDIKMDTMKIKALIFFSIFLITIVAISCASSKISSKRKAEIENKINIAIEHAEMRDEENRIQYLDILRNKDMINEHSEELISNLQKNGYTESDVNKLYNIEIEKILLKEIFNQKLGILDTYYKVYKIANVKYVINYLYDCKEETPNLYTDVFVYDSERKNIRVFYKINYYSEYKILTDGINTYKVFY